MVRPPARAHRPLLAALIALALLACAAPGEDPFAEPEDPQAPRSTATAPPGKQEDGTMTVEEFEDDLDGAVAIAQDYWTQQFKTSGGSFEPIRRVIPYQRSGEVACGGQGVPANNAVYCPAGDFIAYDVNWAYQAFRQIGDAFIFYLLGHEYAHAVQLRLGVQAQFTIQQELQADCMAGAYIGDMERRNRLSLADGDTEELAAGLEAVGDDPGQPWFAEGSHGTARQRTQAFANGYQDSLEPCNLT
jgi:uncharacterized protein